jgi:hypothetical protein
MLLSPLCVILCGSNIGPIIWLEINARETHFSYLWKKNKKYNFSPDTMPCDLSFALKKS